MIKLARPGNWIKNVVVLMPVLFSMNMNDPHALLYAGAAAVAFCFASSFAYILNDIKDIQADRTHPLKKDRPLASGKISTSSALIEAAVFFVVALVIAASISRLLLIMITIYMILQVCYTLYLKQIVLIDVICIAMGFVLRTASGAVAITVGVSPWLFICIFTICLFLGFCKRYNELITLGDVASAHTHRKTLIEYTPDLLTHLITLSAGIAVVAFLFYGLSESTVTRFGSYYFVYSLPIVVYAVFRFAMLSMKGAYTDPTDIILNDRPFQMTVMLWTATAVAIICWGRDLGNYLQSLY